MSKTEAAQSGCIVDITKANSSLPMAKISAALGYKSGFVLDLTTKDENGKKWDFSDLKTQNEIEVRLRQGRTISSWKGGRSRRTLVRRDALCDAVQAGQEVYDRTTSWDESMGNSAHEQVTFREGRWKGELRLRHVRNGIGQGARSQTGEEEDQGVGEVPDKWKTPTRHDAGVENPPHATCTTTSSAKPCARP